MDDFRRWYYRNHKEITWFLIGWCTLSAIQCLGQGDYLGALLSGGFALLNYKMNG
jgi:hypothetical protein